MATGTTFPTATLLADAKNRLNITWTDVSTDSNISDMLRAGKFYLDSKLGGPADYEEPGLPRSLLFEYVRYVRDEALDVFENNYRSLILAMQHGKQVSDFVEST